MAKKVVSSIVVILIVIIAYQFIKVHIENSTLDRNLFAVLSMYHKRMTTGSGTKPKVEDVRHDAYLEFEKLHIPIRPKDIEVEINFEDDFMAIRARYFKDVPIIIYTHRYPMSVDVKLELE